MKIFKGLACLLIAMAIMSCSKMDDNLEKVIPADAAGVVSIDVKSILGKSGLVNDNNEFELPDGLKAVVDENDASPLSQLLVDMPVMGIDTDCRIYAFFTVKTFGAVVLMAIDDEAAARKVIERRTGSDFAQVDGLDCIYQEETFYAIHDNVLFVGRVNKPMEVSKPASAARRMLEHNVASIADDKEIMECIDAENDVNAFMKLDGLKLMLNGSSAYREVAGKFPLVEIFTESDVKAYIAAVNFGKEAVDLDVKVKVDDNSEYMKLLSTTLNTPDASFLKAIPESMDYIASMSVNGKEFVKLPQIDQLVKMFKKMPFIGRLDLASMLATIDGPVAAGLARDPYLDEWNAVIAAKSSDPNAVLAQISSFASALGQQPEIYDGEYIYQYENKMIKLGVKEGVLYVKMLNYEQTEGYAFDSQSVRDFFAGNAIGVYVNASGGNAKGAFKIGLNDKKNIKGSYVANDNVGNSIVSLLTVLCSVKPQAAFDSMDVAEQAMPGAIDELKPVH